MYLFNKAFAIGAYIFIGFVMACQPSGEATTSESQDASSQSDQALSPEVNHDCSFCGMPTQEPDMVQWNGHLVHQGGESWFCSPRCLLLTVKDSGKAPQGIQKLELKDYYTTQVIMAQEAFFVTGSDVLGPMGHDLVPFSDEASAQEFLKEHQGEAMYPFEEISLELIKQVVQKN